MRCFFIGAHRMSTCFRHQCQAWSGRPGAVCRCRAMRTTDGIVARRDTAHRLEETAVLADVIVCGHDKLPLLEIFRQRHAHAFEFLHHRAGSIWIDVKVEDLRR